MTDRFATLPPMFVFASSWVDVDEVRREWARPDGIIFIGGGGGHRPHRRQIEPARVMNVPWPFNLGPNGALFVLLAMEAPFIVALLLKQLGY